MYYHLQFIPMAVADFLSTFIGNPARARMLRVLIFNEGRLMTAAEAGKRGGVTTRDAERELRRMEQWGIARRARVDMPPAAAKTPKRRGKPHKHKKIESDMWTLNTEFNYLRSLASFVHEVSPVKHEKIVMALRRGGRLAAVILSGAFMGDPSRPADLIVAADAFNEHRLDQAVRQLEPMFGREIRYAAFSTPEFRYRLTIQDRLIRDTLDYPHLVLLDKTRML